MERTIISKPLKTVSLKFAILTVGLVYAAQAMVMDLAVVSFGGADKSVRIKAFYEPYQRTTGNKIVTDEYNGEVAEAKAMADTNNVSWDLVEMGPPELSRDCSGDLFEESSPTQFDKIENFVPGVI